ncbi:O-antigen/teichoic acid export membrane protein [Salirhabdus euzebyi]|uniref:O-antigen/teichoic acid export membrane protein n=1 Tax=Salirhabdus euzebyi TaxID=394506 RepID=A0A841Q667_9BACI|nr:flippase [Salirhabdus euzebyi]MBB6453999.1 O-antigen/teichoic acid export membrane protein [Salirhabdus euzebyi]
MNKIVVNYLFNASYQLLVVLLPFITMPYIARVLGPEMLGVNAYTYSIIQILIIVGMVGIPLYGNRQIGIYADKGKEKLSQEFWSIYLIQFVGIITCLVFYTFYSLSLSSEFWIKISLLQGLHLLGFLFDISWLLIGVQKLKETVTRNLIFKILAVILIFTFVKDENDLDLYILIMSGSMVLGQIVIWYYAKDIIHIKPYINIQSLKKHIKPIMILFLPQILGQLYLSLDKVILKVFTTEVQVAYYDQALKIVKLVLTIVTSIGVVMLPNISSEFAKGNKEKVKYYVEKVFRYILFITIPMAIGLYSISSNFVQWFLGPEFLEVADLIKIISPIIFFIGLGSLFGIQILAAIGDSKKLTISIFFGALISVTLSLILVPKYGSYAAAFSTLLAEAAVAVIQFYFVKEYIQLKRVSKSFCLYIISSMLMMVAIYFIGLLDISVILKTFLQVSLGSVIYIGVLGLLKEEFVFDVKKEVISIAIGKKSN